MAKVYKFSNSQLLDNYLLTGELISSLVIDCIILKSKPEKLTTLTEIVHK